MRTFIAVTAALALGGCATHSDYVLVKPVRFVPVVGAGGPSCQGWCPVEPNQATKFRVEVGSLTFKRITSEAKTRGGDGDSAFIEFAKNEVEARRFCERAQSAPGNVESPIHTVEGWFLFWTDVSCSKGASSHADA